MSDAPAIRAGDADRDRTAVALREHLAAGRLTLDEFTERVERAHDARTLVELEELVRDLPEAAPPSAGAPVTPPARERSRARWIVAVMSGAERRRRWRLGERTNVVALMGGVNLDLRAAEIEHDEVTLTVVAVMGGANIVVPAGVPVEVSGFELMGGRNERIADVPPLPGAPRIRIRSFALMGGVNIRSRAHRERAPELERPPHAGPPPPPLPR